MQKRRDRCVRACRSSPTLRNLQELEEEMSVVNAGLNMRELMRRCNALTQAFDGGRFFVRELIFKVRATIAIARECSWLAPGVESLRSSNEEAEGHILEAKQQSVVRPVASVRLHGKGVGSLHRVDCR
jgi:hypothetical protein